EADELAQQRRRGRLAAKTEGDVEERVVQQPRDDEGERDADRESAVVAALPRVHRRDAELREQPDAAEDDERQDHRPGEPAADEGARLLDRLQPVSRRERAEAAPRGPSASWKSRIAAPPSIRSSHGSSLATFPAPIPPIAYTSLRCSARGGSAASASGPRGG